MSADSWLWSAIPLPREVGTFASCESVTTDLFALRLEASRAGFTRRLDRARCIGSQPPSPKEATDSWPEKTMTKRKAIPKKTRFEVFKRDSFTCQYCGNKSPDAVLVIDHIEPVSKGGTNDILNLITSCRDCNAGKSDRPLADTTVLDKRRQQLEDLQERREQLDMMIKWQKGLDDLDDQVISQLSEYWSKLVRGFSFNENGTKTLKELLRRFKPNEIMTAMKTATEDYLDYYEGEPTKESIEEAWKKVGGVCTITRREKENPGERRLYYIRGILRNRLDYLDESHAIDLLHKARDAKASLDSLERHAKAAKYWTGWRLDIEHFIKQQNKGYDPDASEIEQEGH